MNKYYYVSIKDCAIKHDNLSLRDHLWYVSQNLYYRDCSFREFLYGKTIEAEKFDELYYNHEKEDEELYNKEGIPYHLILIDDGIYIYELSSRELFDASDDFILDTKEIAADKALNLLENDNNYYSDVKRFFDTYYANKKTMPPIESSVFRNEPTEENDEIIR